MMQPIPPLEKLFPRLTDIQKSALKKLSILKTEDLLRFFPTRYGDVSEVKNIGSLSAGETAVVFGRIENLKTSKAYRKKIPMAEARIEDETGNIKVVWFNQPYIAKMILDGSLVRIEGKISQRRSPPHSANYTPSATPVLYFSNPKVERVDRILTGVGDSLFGAEGEKHHLHPIYPESRGITSNWFFHAIQRALKSGILDEIQEPIPKEILLKYHLPNIRTALIWIHAPQTRDNALSARKRFAFEEVFLIQLERQKMKRQYQENPAFVIEPQNQSVEEFIKRFPFEATRAQRLSIETILADFRKGHAMSRLLEGDVGSGKTAVAATTAFAAVTTRPQSQDFGTLQVDYMCPTEILAKQQFENFIQYFAYLGVNIGLITGEKCRKFPSKVNPKGWTDISRAQLLKWVESGEIAVLVGTHALIQKTVRFKHLSYVIIDEQHRFGINQRKALVRRQNADITQTDAGNNQKTLTDGFLHKDLTYTIRRIIFSVRQELGLGHKEIIYQRALDEALKNEGITFSREKQIPIVFRSKKIGVYIPDFVIENKIIVELKSLPFIGAKEKKQLWQYLKSSDYRLALLVNFGVKEATIDRVIYDTSRDRSASGLHLSACHPHLLTMTATPIPRTLALTIFGDLDLTLIDEMPLGRKPIMTEMVLPSERDKTYEKIREELKNGRQVYVICPRIDEPDPTKEMAVQAKSAKAEAKRLKEKVFQEYEIGVLHSKMLPKEKEEVMKDFAQGKTHILVATSVVEVGVNVPNATVIVIEGAERFGLAQLHQLRGRVIRSNHQARCFVFTESSSSKTLARLRALKTAKNGFELAEEDLKIRGPGELSGVKQWGITDIGMEALKNIKMVEAARAEAARLLDDDETLSSYPLLKSRLASREKTEIHFE
ncbi:MAG: GxxExxY protein [bacterium]|nr:GxxExxY protein [bacterium]